MRPTTEKDQGDPLASVPFSSIEGFVPSSEQSGAEQLQRMAPELTW
jgi:hypothetical protein